MKKSKFEGILVKDTRFVTSSRSRHLLDTCSASDPHIVDAREK
jgi:hypothetical protein